MAIITLTTDFGLRDHFAGTLKGVILAIAPNAQIVDVSHEVEAFDILGGALTIAQAYKYFPRGTVHVVVVDPGVGSQRRPILACTGTHHFIGPDNGVLSAISEPFKWVRHLTASEYFLKPVSQTFHARDIFAPVAAHLVAGVDAAGFGPEIFDCVRMEIPRPVRDETGSLCGAVLKVDHFGNLITNIAVQDAPDLFEASPPAFKIVLAGREIVRLCSSYAGGSPGEVFAIAGSIGYLEIAVKQGSAAQSLGVAKGAEFSLSVSAKRPRRIIRV